MYLHRLFLVFSCAHPIFRHVIIHSFLFCFAFKPHKFFITFYTLFEHFYHTKYPQLNLTTPLCT